MDTVEINRLEEAVVMFYRSNSQEQAQLHDWLTKVQVSPQAWQFSWQLMQLGKSQEVQFFGAVTLHAKLTKFWHEVPQENREELKQKLLEAIIQFANGPKLVLNRLCIALSAYIVHMLSEWPTAIDDVVNTFQNEQIPNVSKHTQIWIMMEVLQAIPEELHSIYTSVKRTVLRGEIVKKTYLVIETTAAFIHMQLQCNWDSDDYSNLNKAVKCITTWIKDVGYSIENCQNIATLLLKVVNKCYWSSVQRSEGDGCLSADENYLAELSLKALISIVIQPDCHLYPKHALTLINMFLDSLGGITKMEWKPNNSNEDIVCNIYTLFVSAIERHSHLLLNSILTPDVELSSMATRLVNEILQCTDKPGIYPVEESCSGIALGFWYLLQDEVYSIATEPERTKCWEYIQPIYGHLTRVLVRKAEQPNENSLDKWSSDDLETFRCYRQDICDTFMYCFDVLNNDILDILMVVLDESIVALQTNPNEWTKLEACLYAFQSVAEHFEGEEVKQIPKLMRILNEIPYEKLNEKLLGTALSTVGAYCQWLKDNPSYIPSAIELLVHGLNTSMSAQATLGLKELCRDCQLQLKPYAEPLLNPCQAALCSGLLKNSDCVRLMYSIGRLMSLLPAEKIPNYLDLIVSPCFEELSSICQTATKSPQARVRTIYRLNMISTLFSSLNTNLDQENEIDQIKENFQPVLMVMEKTMPIFRHIAELWVEELDVLEIACTALKHAIINLKASFKPMLQDLCCFIVAIFQTNCCAPSLEISKTVIVLFYKDETCTSLMQQLLGEFIQHSFRLFQTTPEDGFSNIAETIEMFYACLTAIIKKLPEALNNKKSVFDFDRLIFYALKAMTLPENGPIRTGIQFLSNCIMQSRNFNDLSESIMRTGEEIVRTTILCVACVAPRQQVEKYADIFLSLNKKYPAEIALWLKNINHNSANFPTTMVSNEERSRFITQIIREKVNKRLLQQHLTEFAIKARGLTDKFQ